MNSQPTGDANKTELTHTVTEAMMGKLYEWGCKPVTTETYVADKWIADIAAIWEPTPTEAIAARLLPKKPRPKSHEDYCGSEFQQRYKDWHEAFAHLPYPICVCCEVKTSVQDYKSDWKFKGEEKKVAAHIMILAIPEGLKITPPKPWWLVTVGEKVKIVQGGGITPISMEEQLYFATSIATRHFNLENFNQQREAMKRYRKEKNETSIERVKASAILALEDIQTMLIEGKKTKEEIGHEILRKKNLFKRKSYEAAVF